LNLHSQIGNPWIELVEDKKGVGMRLNKISEAIDNYFLEPCGKREWVGMDAKKLGLTDWGLPTRDKWENPDELACINNLTKGNPTKKFIYEV
jgi:hypothetical protein